MLSAIRSVTIFALVLACHQTASAQWFDVFNGKNLDGWEVIGEGFWNVMSDGTLVGQRAIHKPTEHQCWLYTTKDFGEYDLHLEYWLRYGGNSGISIRDTTRAQFAHGSKWDASRTPSHNGYEIQISNGDGDEYATGSVYLFAKAKTGVQRDFDWNSLDIESRNDAIRVKVNGQLVAEYAGEPGRPKAGPIGLQLHDSTTLAMFRNIRIREIGKK
jgi:hypothetical protein